MKIVFLAGAAYSEPIDFEDREFYWEEPLAGLGIGDRLAWLKEHASVEEGA